LYTHLNTFLTHLNKRVLIFNIREKVYLLSSFPKKKKKTNFNLCYYMTSNNYLYVARKIK